MNGKTLIPVVLLIVILGVDLFVYSDAKAHENRGRPVEFSNGLVTLDTPAAWLLGCVVIFVVCIPLYFTMRRQA